MIYFRLKDDGKIKFIQNKLLVDHLSKKECRAEYLFSQIKKEKPYFGSKFITSCIAQHPIVMSLVSLEDNIIDRSQVFKLLDLLDTIDEKLINRIQKGMINVEQKQAYLPDKDTRGASIIIDVTAPENVDSADNNLLYIENIVGSDWKKLISIIKTISYVIVDDMPDLPYFSGSSNSIWGAIHMSYPANHMIFAESLTHEAAHYWLHLIEELHPIANDGWTDEVWVSPWRGDPRPVAGILHGVHVFSCAIVVLSSLFLKALADNNETEKKFLHKRICNLIAQVEEGIFEIERSKKATKYGQMVVDESKDRLIVPLDIIKSREIDEARNRISIRRHEKMTKWRNSGIAFND